MEIKKINLDQPSTPTPSQTSTKQNKLTTPLLVLLVLFLGVSTGAILKTYQAKSGGGMSGVKTPTEGGNIKAGDVFGTKDKTGFPDEATGILEAGGIDGEGTHKLLRPGGISQTAYLTSSILDLDEFIGLKITIWGETFSAQKAGWLMDVGRVEVNELNPAPFEE